MHVRSSLAVAAFIAAAPSFAFAADALTIPVSTEAAVPIAEGPHFDWTGFYGGIYGVAQSGPVSGLQYGAGLALGANLAIDFFLVGGEVAFHGLLGGAGSTTYAQVLAKGGLLVTDDIAIYAAGGYGINTGAPVEDQALLGGGVEFAVSEDVSLRAQYLHGFPITGANPVEQVTLGANLHF
jgi:outer membrane immunogenic protein